MILTPYRWFPVSNGSFILCLETILNQGGGGASEALACFSLKACFSSGPLEKVLKQRARCLAARGGDLEVCKSLHLDLDFPGLGWHNRFLCLWPASAQDRGESMLEETLQPFSPSATWLGVMEAEMTCTPPGALAPAVPLTSSSLLQGTWLASVCVKGPSFI